jgi:diaminopimelate decarboxylase
MGLVTYKAGNAYIDSVSLKSLGERFGTPLYVYSRKKIKENW